MMKTICCMLIVGLLMIGNSGYTSNHATKKIALYYKDVPAELQADIDKQVNLIESENPITNDERNNIHKSIIELNIKYSYESESQEEQIRSKGCSAIPVVVSILESQDMKNRRNALYALGLIQSKLKHSANNYEKTKNYAKIEKTIINILCRTIFDSSAEVRKSAICMLFGIGSEHIGQVPGSIKTSLKEAMKNDPDPVNRKAASYRLQDLNIIPRDKDRNSIAN